MVNLTKFSKIEVHPQPESTLYSEEIDALIAVASQIAENHLQSLKGTFILDEQPHQHSASCVCRFNMLDGSCARRFFCGSEGDSEALAVEAIDQLLKPSATRTRYRNIWPHHFDNVKGCMCVGGGIHCDGALNVLVLNSTYGKFMAASYLDCASRYDFDGNVAVLVAVATAFSEMMREDITLQRSFAKIRQAYDYNYIQVIQNVQEMFAHATLPELKKWRIWHEPANQSGNLRLPFEEKFTPEELAQFRQASRMIK